ncbi:uncharacterized protein LOC130757093 isoform X1 [Actinidia eriantha]|uniref:uncharacterized protein LOC130757093 isoform X1 n=1 Tax=Actinidia eriantha TaxID=165200 RepID=UPI0025905B92|nr:uncharacterized protein LOC130757093 isoform X1 [Actinidia eriantha]
MESIIQEKSATITSLRSDIQALQQKGSLDAKEQLGRAHLQINELEKQVDSLRNEIETQNKQRDAVEARADVAEKKVLELNLKLETLKTINDKQKARIRKTERALQVAEEEMMNAKLEATTVSKELIEVREAWIPHWLAAHLLHCQSFIVTQWKENGRPALDVTFQKALQKKAQVEKWTEPHFRTVKTKWVPTIKDQWLRFVTQIGPHVKSLTAKSVEVYHASKNTIEPHVVKVQEMVDPYLQEGKKFAKPYIDQVATVTRPHVDKARVFLKPYTKKVTRTYRKFVKAVTMYHRRVQGTLHEKLKNHELMKPLATNGLVWFLASFVMALPVIFLFKVASAIFWKKNIRNARNSRTSHSRRRAKRVHSDN